MENTKPRFGQTLKFAGGFVAWVIGSGFATGQEILQFFSSYGIKSFLVLLINLAGFLIVGTVLLLKGYDNKSNNIPHFEYFCGKKIGKIYSVIILITLIFLMPVLISAAGATFSQYFGINKYIGSAVMAAAVLAAYLIGFDRMVKIVSSFGPLIIVFSIFVGVVTVIRGRGSEEQIISAENLLSELQTAPHWSLSALLYISLNFLCGSTYYTQLGKSAERRSEAKLGAIIGSLFLIITILLMNVSILLNAENTAGLSVPTLYFAQQISSVFGGVFSVVLVLGIFSSCSTMMWSFSSRFFADNKKKNTAAAAATTVITFVIGMFPFGGLVAVIYPAIGYIGLFFIGCVIFKGLKRKR